MENGRDEEEEVDGEQVIRWCSRRTGNGSYDGVQPDKGNKEGEDTVLRIFVQAERPMRNPAERFGDWPR